MSRSLMLGLIALLAAAVPALADPAPDTPTAATDAGVVRGFEQGPAWVFKAIPYAAPPVGRLRWRPPAPAVKWSGVRDATADGPACPQAVFPGGRYNAGGYSGPTSEDCLT